MNILDIFKGIWNSGKQAERDRHEARFNDAMEILFGLGFNVKGLIVDGPTKRRISCFRSSKLKTGEVSFFASYYESDFGELRIIIQDQFNAFEKAHTREEVGNEHT